MEETSADPVRSVQLGRAGTAQGLFMAAATVVALVAVASLLGWEAAIAYPMAMSFAVVVAVLYVLVARRTHVLKIDDDGITVRSPKKVDRYLWSELLEIGWARGLWPYRGPGLVIRPKGGPWDVPGPYAPAQVATLSVFGRSAHRQAQDVLREACRRHGVEFAENGLRMGPDPPRGARR
jgi:hypothetical protein